MMKAPILQRALSLLLFITCALAARAQSIRVSVMDAADTEHTVDWFDYGQDVRIDLAAINSMHPQFKFIRVMDTALPLGDISRVSLYRSSTTTTIPDAIKVFVGSIGSGSFPVDFNLRIPIEGCNHWGLPLTPGGSDDALVVEPSVPEGTKIILAAALSGDLTGKITTGQVFRLQVTDGVIADDVRATSPSAHPESDVHPERTYTIERVVAKSITGRIIAGDEVGPPTNMAPEPCSIRDIVVGDAVHTETNGIYGDILAYGGHIRHIESTGHIGTAEEPINIHSGLGLAELFCTAQVNGQTAPRNVHADVAVNLLAPTTGSTHDYDGFLRRIRVSGSLYGSVKANIMRPEPVNNPYNGYEGSDIGGRTNGLFVGGGVHAGITLRQGVLVASMIADEFTQTIEMDTYLKGLVIARSGGISALLVGTHPHENTIDGPGDSGWHHGFVGSAVRPDWDPAALFPFPNCAQDPSVANEPAAIVRAATSIGYLDISQMVKGSKLVPPMVEAPRIDVLRIGSLEYGVVWSGVRANCTPQPHNGCSNPTELGSRCGADPNDPVSYAELGDAEIQSTAGFDSLNGIYPEYDAGLYVASFDRLDTMSRFMVHLHLRTLDEAANIRIGCSFGSQGTNDTGRIYVHDPSGLHGQITVNAHAALSPSGACAPSGVPGNGDGSLGWWERVFVKATDPGDPPLDEYVLCTPGIYPNPVRPASSAADEGPFYHRLPIDLGGGAIGQVPFNLHDLACDPPLTEDIENRAFSNAAFCQLPCAGSGEPYDLASITLDFYGPVRTWPLLPEVPDDEETPITVVSIADTTGYDYARDLDVTITRGEAGPLSRFVVVKGRPGVLLPVGTYIVKPRRAGAYPLLCDGLFDTAPSTPVADFAYLFKLWSDCNRNGVDDTADIAADPVLDIWPRDGRIDDCNQCDGDYNLDGNVDQEDISCFTGLVGGDVTSDCHLGLVSYLAGLGLTNPASHVSTLLDVNNDGNVDQDDVSALINIVGGGGCP